jgi:transcriptional regulator with XRE-family HTH domain
MMTEESGSLRNRERLLLIVTELFRMSHLNIARIKSFRLSVNTDLPLLFSTKMKSRLKTPVAIVRNRIGLSVEEFAHLIRRSVGAVQRLERGDLKLSDKTAWRIQDETGAPADWLLKDNPALEPVIPGGIVWSKEVFEVHQGQKQSAEVAHKIFGSVNYTRVPARQRQEKSHAIAKYLAVLTQADIHASLAQAILKGEHEFEKAVLALNRFRARMAKEFGIDGPTRELYERDIALTGFELSRDAQGRGQSITFAQHGKNYRIEKDGKINEIQIQPG